MRSENQPSGKRTFVDSARRDQLVECAIDAIDELGYPRASLAEIARRAGISKAAIFYHFTNREELVDAVFAEVVARGGNYLLPRLNTADGPAAELRSYIRVFTESLSVDRRVIRVLVAISSHLTDADGMPRLLRDDAIQQAALDPIEDILRRGQRAGEFGDFDIRHMALSIRAILETLPQRLITWPDLDLDSYADHVIDLLDRATRP